MKKIFLSIVLCPFFLLSHAQQGNTQGNQGPGYYDIGYAFTGKIENVADSVFAVCFTFPADGFSNIQSVVIDEVTTITLTGPNAGNKIEIHNNGNTVSVWIKKYDKYDPPVITHLIDIAGNKKKLYNRMGNGQLQEPSQVKETYRLRRDALRGNTRPDRQ